jgi:predicted esterase
VSPRGGGGALALLVIGPLGCAPAPSPAGWGSSEPTAQPAAAPAPASSAQRDADATSSTPDGSAAVAPPRASLVSLTLAGRPAFELPLDGTTFDPALIAVPAGASESAPRPLVVATHGAEDDVPTFCSVIVAAVADRAFVLCPRGKRVDRRDPPARARYFYANHLKLTEELEASVAAATTAFAPRLDPTRAVYLGYSQGAMMGALVLANDGSRFPRTVSIEGVYGSGQWSVDMGARYRRHGGERALFLCGGSLCATRARASARALGQGGSTLTTRIVQAPGGHTYGGPMADALARELSWIFDGDPRFAGP